MVDVAEEVVADLSAPVAAMMPLAAARIPAGPAAELGRLGAPEDPGMRPRGRNLAIRAWARARPSPGPPPARTAAAGLPPARTTAAGLPQARTVPGQSGDSPVVAALGELGPLRVERLLGALELTVPSLDAAGVPDLSPYLGPAPSGRFAFAETGQDSEALVAARMLERLYPGAVDLVESLARRLAGHRRIAGLLAVAPDATDEPSIAAGHGRAYLALAVATATAVLRQLHVGALVDRSAAVVGVAVGTAAVLLRDAPMPAGYATAVLAKVRAEYLLPRHTAGTVPVAGHRFALTEGGVPDTVDFAGNGLVAVVEGGAVIRTGIERGSVTIVLTVLAEPPPSVADGWDEVVEVSWRAAEGRASVTGPDAAADWQLRQATPPWPGDYRLRVHARGRDEVEDPGSERYELIVWQAPAAPEIVHRRTDRLGHRLRGEPEPVRPERPELAYRWVRRSALGDAATVTVATGTPVDEVLRAFGADPAQPESTHDIAEDLHARRSIDPWVAVLDTGDAVIAVEYNGFQGSHEQVLCPASARGRAASMFWNVNALTQLSFAEGGRLLASFEPPAGPDQPPAVAAALAGLDFGEPGDRTGKGLVAVQRFTGRGITAEDLARIEAAGIGFRIMPHLPVLYPFDRRRVDTRLGLDPAAIEGLADAWLRDLAWWIAAEAARYAGVAGDPDVAAAVAARALTAGALTRARRSQLDGGEHRWLWLTLHQATNPDPRAAVADALYAARYAAGPHAAELLEAATAAVIEASPKSL